MHFCAGSLSPWAADLKSGPWKGPARPRGGAAQVQVQGGAVCLQQGGAQPAAPARAAPDPYRLRAGCITGLMQLQGPVLRRLFPRRPDDY